LSTTATTDTALKDVSQLVQKAQLLYEGKAKKVYRTDSPDLYIVEYKDDATAFNGAKRGTIEGKGVVNNRISNRLFQLLEQHGVPTHFVETLSDRETCVKAVRILPLEVVVRNLAAGSLSKRLGIEEGKQLARPLIEFYYKDDALGDPLISAEHAEILGFASKDDIEEIQKLALKVNEVLSGFMAERGILLVDFKLEFGKTEDGTLLLADEISPDTCRFWDKNTHEKLDKDRFRQSLGGVEEAYQEMMRRVGGQDE
jgi:phosphoribosylaminoimidazole-succinocarboxamide synthase